MMNKGNNKERLQLTGFAEGRAIGCKQLEIYNPNWQALSSAEVDSCHESAEKEEQENSL